MGLEFRGACKLDLFGRALIRLKDNGKMFDKFSHKNLSTPNCV